MDTISIKEALRQLVGHMDIPYYVCAADTAPKIDKFPTIVIQNSDPIDRPGEHWLAWWAVSDLRCEFFDSFGLPYVEYPHLDFPIKYIVQDNTKQLQSNESNYCGIWSVRFAHDKTKGLTFHHFMNQWTSLQKEINDRIILKWFMRNTTMFPPQKVYDSCKNQTCISYDEFKKRRNCCN